MRRIYAAVLIVAAVLTPAAAWPRIEGDPIFAGIWSRKETAGTGGLFHNLTWEELVARWKELGAQNQYLADVEVYRKNGERRFAAAWRIGPGNGALLLAPWVDFVKTWNELKANQELIDLKIVGDGSARMVLGVWRRKQEPGQGSGALFIDMTWDQLIAARAELRGQYLADVETYVDDGKRLFAGVWRTGADSGALYWKNDWKAFVEQKKNLDQTQELLDLNMFQTDDGRWNFLGVWRGSKQAGPVDASSSAQVFKPLSANQFVDKWSIRNGRMTLTGLAVATPLTFLRGDTNCRHGDPDCNRCANDVPTQFRLAFEGGHRPWIGWHESSWEFRGNDRYPPDNAKPEDAFRPFGEGAQVGVVSKHVQGFVRTNSTRFPYAGSHSHKDRGSIFIVENGSGGKALHSLYKSATGHPSGVAVLGDGLFVAEKVDGKGHLRVFRIGDSGKPQQQRYALEELGAAGGGLGLTKLHDGSTLLISSAPGDGFRKGTFDEQRDENLKPRSTRFWRLTPNAFHARPGGTVPFGKWSHDGISARPDKPMAYSENLSVVTECQSAKIYTVHTTGDWGLRGDGYWRLSRVDDGPQGPHLVHVAIARQNQHNERCHHRSSATVHVNRDGQLEFLCTERAVVKWNPGTFNFELGKP